MAGLKLKRQKSGDKRYWTVHWNGKYVASLGRVDELGDPPQMSLQEVKGLSERLSIPWEEVEALVKRGRLILLGVASDGEAEEEGGSGGEERVQPARACDPARDRNSPVSLTDSEAEADAEPLIRVRYKGKGTYLLFQERILFRPGDVKALPESVYRRLEGHSSFERLPPFSASGLIQVRAEYGSTGRSWERGRG